MKTKIILLALALIVLAGFRPDRSIVGKVTLGSDGSNLPGINVVLKGASNGTVTDTQGNYVLTVPDQGGSLIFSFIGLKTKEVKISTKSRIDVVMEKEVTMLQ